MAIDWVPPVTRHKLLKSENPHGNIRFHGSISTELPPDNIELHRSGYAAWRTKDRKFTLFGNSYWDLDGYAYLALRIKSDGRRYFVNVQTDSVVHTDIHQHRLYARKPGEWETVLIKWNDFVRTNHGTVVEPQSEIMRSAVKSIGIGLTDRKPGPFDISIERIWAANEMAEEFIKEDDRMEQGQIQVNHLEKIRSTADKSGKK